MSQCIESTTGHHEVPLSTNRAMHVTVSPLVVTTTQRNALDGSIGGKLTNADIGYTVIDSTLTNSTGELSVWVFAGTTAGFIPDQRFTNGAAHIVMGSGGGATAVTTLENFVIAGGATQSGTSINMPGGRCTFQAVANGSSGAFAATVAIMVSNDNSNFIQLGTIALSGTATTADTDGFASDSPWAYVRADISGFSGTGGTCSIYMGV